MKKEFLEQCLAEGMSLDAIGALAGRHPSTVSYHLRKHGLRAVNSDSNSPRGSEITKGQLEQLLGSGASLRELAADLQLSVSSVRYWLNKHGLAPTRVGRRRAVVVAALAAGATSLERLCPHHGVTTFVLETRGYYRCRRCRSQAVSKRRRLAKTSLVAAAGGRCALCGYDRYQGALQFHHLDPSTKRFAISRKGATRAIAEAAEEAAKCILLCANCHAEVEAGASRIPGAAAPATVIAASDPG